MQEWDGHFQSKSLKEINQVSHQGQLIVRADLCSLVLIYFFLVSADLVVLESNHFMTEDCLYCCFVLNYY